MSASTSPAQAATTGRAGLRASRGRLRLLFLSQRFPLPPDTGGKIRTTKILERLTERFAITLVSQVQHPQDEPWLGEIARLCDDFHAIPWHEPVKYTSRFYLGVLGRSLSRYPVTVAGDASREVTRTLRRLAHERRHDLLVCDFLQPSVNFHGLPPRPTLLFQHNVESTILRRHLQTAANPLLKAFWWSQWRKMVRFERRQCHRFSGIVAVSEVDKRTLETEFGARRVFAIPTGVDIDHFTPDATGTEDPGTLVFTGAMDWLPNEDAAVYFVERILPRIAAAVPGTRFVLVGRNPSARLRARLDGRADVTVTGRVDDIRPFVGRGAVYVIPLRIGGGTRIKAYEAMAMGKAVVSTRIGVEGLPVVDGEHLLVADTPGAFADAVIGLLRDVERRRRLGRAARGLVARNFGWDRAAAAFAEACHATVDA